MLRCTIFFLTLVFLLALATAAQTAHLRYKVIDVNDLQTRIAEDSAVTYADLLKKIDAGVAVKKTEKLGELVFQDSQREEIESVRALWFLSGVEHLALVVTFSKAAPDGADKLYNAALLIFNFQKVGGELVQLKRLEDWSAVPAPLDFYDAEPIVVLRNTEAGEDAFWIIGRQENENLKVQKFSLMRLKNKLLDETLSDLPRLETRRKGCDYSFKQELGEIKPFFRDYSDFTEVPNVEIKILEYTRGGNDCAAAEDAPEADRVKTFVARWNGKFYHTELFEQAIPFNVPPRETPKADAEFDGTLELGKVYRAEVVYSKIGDGWRLAVPLKRTPNETIKIEWYYKDRSLLYENRLKPGETRAITFQIISVKPQRFGFSRLVTTYRAFVYPIGEEIPEC